MERSIEVWKPIPEFENYIVNNFGIVKSLDWNYICSDGRRFFRKGRILKPQSDAKKYLRVNLCGKFKPIHRLMALAFLENPLNLDTVDHIDEIKQNNFIFINSDGTVNHEKSNLRWLSNHDNILRGTRGKRIGQSNINNPFFSTPILSFDKKNMSFIEEFPSLAEAGRAGFNYKNISQCLNGKRKSCNGRIWKRKEAPIQ